MEGTMDQPAREPIFRRVGDGIWAQVEDRSGPLPRHLDSGAHEGRIGLCRCRPLLDSMGSLQVFPIVLVGTRLACRDQHDLLLYATGTYAGLELRLSICRYCGAIEVRDVSIDYLVDGDARGGRRFITQPRRDRRRDLVLGWYAGRRVSGRIYR
jgi:hypothetical protein